MPLGHDGCLSLEVGPNSNSSGNDCETEEEHGSDRDQALARVLLFPRRGYLTCEFAWQLSAKIRYQLLGFRQRDARLDQTILWAVVFTPEP
jgi:hypothetical protein